MRDRSLVQTLAALVGVADAAKRDRLGLEVAHVGHHEDAVLIFVQLQLTALDRDRDVVPFVGEGFRGTPFVLGAEIVVDPFERGVVA